MAKEKSAERFYPTLEVFLEQETRSGVAEAFDDARGKLSGAKGTKAAAAKKAVIAIEKTETLLHHLFDVKERLAAEAAAKQKK